MSYPSSPPAPVLLARCWADSIYSEYVSETDVILLRKIDLSAFILGALSPGVYGEFRVISEAFVMIEKSGNPQNVYSHLLSKSDVPSLCRDQVCSFTVAYVFSIVTVVIVDALVLALPRQLPPSPVHPRDLGPRHLAGS
ncbi:hypothetical protein H920_13818 [Fukomys damarensis]|uniref:Uncharacterized protein n=1 Tax=Fukomys damarensis TaxID=885580 RepID=A0A091D1G9_FUKDA|nr:hypothetical protein H920_13818 [Fukomys damarensis]